MACLKFRGVNCDDVACGSDFFYNSEREGSSGIGIHVSREAIFAFYFVANGKNHALQGIDGAVLLGKEVSCGKKKNCHRGTKAQFHCGMIRLILVIATMAKFHFTKFVLFRISKEVR